ncbi:hypothetical protein TNCV_3180041 [Trichonephila clavipes]|nr:hypothetical protein TNCV_3180041 [Trichonephila clavipes]
MHNATVQQPLITVSPNSNPTIVMLQAEAGSISKHNVVPFRCLFPSFIAPLVEQMPVVSSQGQIQKLCQKTARCLPRGLSKQKRQKKRLTSNR